MIRFKFFSSGFGDQFITGPCVCDLKQKTAIARKLSSLAYLKMKAIYIRVICSLTYKFRERATPTLCVIARIILVSGEFNQRAFMI